MREAVEQGRLARVRVADERDVRDLATLARLPLCLARRCQPLEVLFEFGDAAQEATAVDLELRLSGTARVDAESLLAELETATAQVRQPVAQLRELDLHCALLAGRMLSEDVEDQRDAV